MLCERVAGRTLEAGAVRRLQILTGGSPRLLAIMARFASERSFHTLMSDLLDLVDEHTAYFKSHLESLPAQEAAGCNLALGRIVEAGDGSRGRRARPDGDEQV